MAGVNSETGSRREEAILRINTAIREGVFSMRDLARASEVPLQTLSRYIEKGYVNPTYLPQRVRYERIFAEALSHEFTNKQELLDHLGWSDGYTRSVSKRYGIRLPDFRSIKKPERKWQKGTIAENRESIDGWLDSGENCADIAGRLKLSTQSVWAYQQYRKEHG